MPRNDDNWNLLKLLYFIKTFYPDFDPDRKKLEQSLIITSDKSLLYMFYIKMLLDSIEGIALATTDFGLSEPVISFELTSVPGEFVYDIIDLNSDDIYDEMDNYSYFGDVDDSSDNMSFYVPIWEDACPETRNLIECIFAEELFTALEGYIYVQFFRGEEVNICLSVNLNNLIPDKLCDMLPIEEFIKFKISME